MVMINKSIFLNLKNLTKAKTLVHSVFYWINLKIIFQNFKIQNKYFNKN